MTLYNEDPRKIIYCDFYRSDYPKTIQSFKDRLLASSKDTTVNDELLLDDETITSLVAYFDNECKILKQDEYSGFFKNGGNGGNGKSEQKQQQGQQSQPQKKSEIELISVASAIRRSSGKVAVKGMIMGISTAVQVVTKTKFKCSNPDCQHSLNVPHNPPLFSLPSHLTLGRDRKCDSCGKTGLYGPDSHVQKSAMTIQLQDEQKQNDLESLNVVLFEDDTEDVRNGDKAIIIGDLRIVQNGGGSNSKRVTYLFANADDDDVNNGIQSIYSTCSNGEILFR